ncbi:uncharacterized protein LOC141900669 [Tubulanus polymorphus]|uniref:uncharacterized protein LOC141900669 n=1 Tax=Tubulanus polymorphus TaxID=672921 RepID=UPI003DA4D2DA
MRVSMEQWVNKKCISLFRIDTPQVECDPGLWLKWTVYPGRFISDYNDRGYNDMTIKQCEIACLTEETFKCLSADYNKNNSLCNLSSVNKKVAPSKFEISKAKMGDDNSDFVLHHLEWECVDSPMKAEIFEGFKAVKSPSKSLANVDSLLQCSMECKAYQSCTAGQWDIEEKTCDLISNGDLEPGMMQMEKMTYFSFKPEK